MEDIIRVHFDRIEEKLLSQAIAAFYQVREMRGLEKKPSTSELIDWLRALSVGGVNPSRITKTIPLAGVLLKKDKDIAVLNRNLRR